MQIPHVDTIRELRAVIATGAGAPELRQKIQITLAQIGVMRRAEADEVPGEALMDALSHRPGLEGIRAADASVDAPWATRLQARELALRSAEALLAPVADAAHHASHELHDLRIEQLEHIRRSDDPAFIARIDGMLSEHAGRMSAIKPIEMRLSLIAPARTVVNVYVDQLGRALESTAPIRDALCDTFAQSAREDVASVLANLELHEPGLEGTPAQVYEVVLAWKERLDDIEAEAQTELSEAQASERRQREAIEDILG